jgi:hypothetical protein
VRRALCLLTLAATALGAAGCGGDKEDFQPAPLATPKAIRLEVYDRSYSECASYSLDRLAGKYRVDKTRDQVSLAVGHYWANFFDGRTDAVRSGRDGCLQGMDSK